MPPRVPERKPARTRERSIDSQTSTPAHSETRDGEMHVINNEPDLFIKISPISPTQSENDLKEDFSSFLSTCQNLSERLSGSAEADIFQVLHKKYTDADKLASTLRSFSYDIPYRLFEAVEPRTRGIILEYFIEQDLLFTGLDILRNFETKNARAGIEWRNRAHKLIYIQLLDSCKIPSV